MKIPIGLLLLFTLFNLAQVFAASGQTPSQARNEAFLSIGRSTTWPVGKGEAISVSNGSVTHVIDQGAQVKITGRKIGNSTLQSGSRSLLVTVLPEPAYRVYEKLDRAISGRRGLELSSSGNTPVVHGRLLRFSDWQALAQAERETQSEVYLFNASVDAEMRKTALAYFKHLMTAAGLPDLDIQLEPCARIAVPTDVPDLKDRVGRILAPFGFKIDVTPSALSLEPLVQVHIVVAEIRKKMLNQLGIEWPGAIEGQILPNPAFPTGGQLGVTLHALEEKGWGQVLASPTLLCRSGKEASFLAGGEFPIKIINYKTQDVIWKKYGVLLQISPRADFNGRMSIAIQTEVSMIDPSHTVDGVPGLLTNRIETHFDLAKSQTIALSGLIKREWSESAQGLPGLGSLPILGPLFSSREYRDDRSELVILVTPELARTDEGS